MIMKRLITLISLLVLFSILSAGVQDEDELWKKFREIEKNNQNWQFGLITTKQITTNKKGEVQNDMQVVIRCKETELGIESEFVSGTADGAALNKDDKIVEQMLKQYGGKDDDGEEAVYDRKDLHLAKTDKTRKISEHNCVGYDFHYEDEIDMSKDKSGSKLKKVIMMGTFWLDEVSGALIMQESTFDKPPSKMIKEMHNAILYKYNEKGEWMPIEISIDMKLKVMFMTALSSTNMKMSEHFKKKNL